MFGTHIYEDMKDRQLHLRLSKDQLKTIQKNARDNGCSSVTEYVLQSVGLERQINAKEIFKALNSFVMDEKRVENNINQIARHLNQNPSALSENLMNDYKDQINKYMDKRDELRVLINKLIGVIAGDDR